MLSSHGALSAGMRTSQSMPTDISAGPTVMKMRGPNRLASAPKRVDRKTRKSGPGISASPTAAAV